MSSLVIGPNKDRLWFSINQTDLLAPTNQQLVAPVDGFIDFMEVIVQVAVGTGGTLTLKGGGTFFNPDGFGLDMSSFAGRIEGDTPMQVTAALAATVAITIAAPGVVTWANHGLPAGAPVVFTSTGSLPTGVTSGTQYYVSPRNRKQNTFQLTTTPFAASDITTSGSQSGVHTGTAGQLGTTPVAGGVITVPNSAAAGAVYSATPTVGDPTTLIKAGSPLVLVPASFASTGAVQGFIQFRSQR